MREGGGGGEGERGRGREGEGGEGEGHIFHRQVLKFPVARKYSICLPTSGAMGNTLLMMFARRGREGEGQSNRKRAACQVHTSALPLLPSNLSGDSLVLHSSSERTKRRKLSNLSFRTMR